MPSPPILMGGSVWSTERYFVSADDADEFMKTADIVDSSCVGARWCRLAQVREA